MLADLLVKRGGLDGLRARAGEGDHSAAWRMAELLAERGDLDEAVQVLRARVEAGDWHAAYRAAELQAQLGDLDGLRARTDEGDDDAAIWLADLLARRGDLDGLRDRADQGDHAAAGRVAELLAERGEVDRLRARAEAGDGAAAVWLAGAGQARRRGRAARPGRRGDEHAARELAGLLAERGDLDEAAQIMRARAEAGDRGCCPAVRLLAERGDLDGLRARADGGDAVPPGGWSACWPSAATWTGCAPGPTTATWTRHGSWPACGDRHRGQLSGVLRDPKRRWADMYPFLLWLGVPNGWRVGRLSVVVAGRDRRLGCVGGWSLRQHGLNPDGVNPRRREQILPRRF